MKKLKLFFTMLMLIAFSVGNVWGAVESETTYAVKAAASFPTDWTYDGGFSTGGGGYIQLTSNSSYIQTDAFCQNGFTSVVVKARKVGGPDATQGVISVDWWEEGATEPVTLGTVSPSGTTLADLTISSPADVTGNKNGYIKISCKGASSSKGCGVSEVTITYTAGSCGSVTPTCAAPTFDPEDGEKFDESIDVEINAEDGATIYYTTDGNAPTTSSSEYSIALHFTETTTLKAMAVKAGSNNSAVATATYTKIVTVPGYAIDFESELDAYVDWEFSNIGIRTSTITAHGGTYYGSNVNGNGNATTTAAINTKAKVATPGVLTFYISKESKNTTASSWKAQVSADGSEWTEVETFDATSMSKGDWNECTADLSEYSNVYVRIYYEGSNAIRAIDDIELAMASDIAKPSISGADNFLTSSEISMACTTEGAEIYYTTDGTDPKSGSKYTAAFSIDDTKTVKAIAKVGEEWSAVAEATFTKATVMTVAQALAAEPANNKYVKGIIASIEEVSIDHGNATYNLKDEGESNAIKIYRGKYLDNANFTAADQIAVGDEVTVFGNLTEYQSVNQFAQGNYIVALKPAAKLAWSESSYEAELEGENTFPSLTNTNSVTVTYSSSNTDVATINANTGAIELKATGTTTITAAFAGNETYKANSVSYSLEVKNAVIRADISFEENGGSEVADLTQQTNLPNPLPAITKAGMNFGGWFTDNELETPAVAGAAVTSTAAITLYAKWLEPYTVAEALTMISALEDGETTTEFYYVSGEVTSDEVSLESGNTATYKIKDANAENSLTIYKGKGKKTNEAPSGEAITEGYLQESDAVVLYGQLQKYVKNEVTTPEVKSSYIYSLDRPSIAVTGVTLESTASVVVGGTVTLHASVVPSNATNKTIVWSVQSGSDYASVDANGVVTGSVAGEAVVRATAAADENIYAECTVTVTEPAPLPSGNVVILAEFNNTFYAMSNSLNNGALAGVEVVKDGSNLVVTSQEDKDAIQWTATVDDENTTLKDASNKYIKGGSNASLSLDDNAFNWTWDAQKSCYVNTVTTTRGLFFSSNGNVFKGYALSNITDNEYAAIDVIEIAAENIIVDEPAPIAVTGVELDQDAAELEAGQSVTLVATVSPAEATNKNVTWESDDTDVAIVDANGKITAVAAGDATITVTTVDGSFTATCAVTVTAAPTPVPFEGDYFVKVADDSELTAGEYLIVYEEGNLAFNGGLETLDAASNTVDVTFENGKIQGTDEVLAATFIIKLDGTIQSKSGYYIGRTDNTNGLNSSTDEAYTNTISIDGDGNAVILASGGAYLRYNATSGQERFRYFKSSSYTTQKAIQLYKKETVTPEPPVVDYTEVRNGLTEGWYYTMCLDKAVTAVKGGSIWRVLSKAANDNDVILEEAELPLVAGRPYIFRAAASTLEVAYTGDAVDDPVTEGNNGLVGWFGPDDNPIEKDANNYIIYNNELYLVNSDNVVVRANRAYLYMPDVPAYSNEPQQGNAPRRRVVMGVHGTQTATGMDALNASDAPAKVLINGQLFILRGEKMYDAKGQLVK